MQELFNIFNAFEELGYESYRQGSLSDDNYPDSFFTYWNFDTPETLHRDNNCKEYTENVMVYFYTNNPSLIYSVMEEFISAAKAAGIKIMGRAYDCPTDKDNYFGRLVRIKIIHKEE